MNARLNLPSSAEGATHAERSKALRVAASVLKARWPAHQATCMIVIGPNTLEAHAQASFEGVVKVTLKHTGELVAMSLPGFPFNRATPSDLSALLTGPLAEYPGTIDWLEAMADALVLPEWANVRGYDLAEALRYLSESLDGTEP